MPCCRPLVILVALLLCNPAGADPGPRSSPASSASARAEAPRQVGYTAFSCRRRPRLVQLASAPGLAVTRARRSWGSRLTVRRLRELGAAWRARFGADPPLRVRDISARYYRRISGHASHCSGQDVDLQLPLRHTAAYIDATPQTLDLERTWFLLLSLAATCDAELIFVDRALQHALRAHARAHHPSLSAEEEAWLFQYPHRGARGLVRHWPHHKNHLHVRFRHPRHVLNSHGAARLCRAPAPGQPAPAARLLAEQAARLDRPPGSP